ncbi:hypothetical protein [Aliikangiella sp. IMCC44359]|uniref:hypothetical protein n=1 Tax=Aliikangiella sp. IMCC44359 TaxID=3459125 RepID=UPI00403A96A4
MGLKLSSFYDQAESIGGLKARMRLAMISGIPSSKAESEPDSPDNISKLQKALDEIQKEFN